MKIPSKPRLIAAFLLAAASFVVAVYTIGAPLLREYREAAYIERLRAPSPFLFHECLVRLDVEYASTARLTKRESRDQVREAFALITYSLNELNLPVGAAGSDYAAPNNYYLAFTKDCDARDRLAAQLIEYVRATGPTWLTLHMHRDEVEPGPETIPTPESDFWRDE